jgi:hypothetical protein
MAGLLFTHRPLLDLGVKLLYVPPPPPLPDLEAIEKREELETRRVPFLRRSASPISPLSPQPQVVSIDSGDGSNQLPPQTPASISAFTL